MSDIGGKSRSAVTSAASGQSGLGPQLDTFREVRRNLEASVLPLATSVDGRRFSFQASLYGLELQVGSYVVLEGGGTRYLGQVLTLGLDRQPVTELTLPAQSAGVPEARTEVQIRYASGEGTVLEGHGAPFHDLLVMQAALLRLDPVDDREEYAELAELLASENPPTLAALTGSDHPVARRLGLRVRGLGVDRFSVWASGEPGSVLDAVRDQEIRCVVVDLGSLPTREEQALVAGAVLGDLWRRRQEHRPILIVIDEAHNVCPAEPSDQLVTMAADHATRIAAEGRKFGLYLLVSTQRPQKIPDNVLSQADNLVLMRLNSLADAAFAQAAFPFVPPSLIERSVTFRQGEGLIAGKISPQPALLRFGARISQEGGADVPATWAAAR
jgi:hypothetical protein